MTALPFVTLKFAISLDGRIATKTGDSQWISGSDSLQFAHQLRAGHDAIMVGIGTVLADNPRLNVRLVEGRDPLRVIVDSRLQIPNDANVLIGGAAKNTLIATSEAADKNRLAEIENLGAEVLRMPSDPDSQRVNLQTLLAELHSRSLQSVLVEGGAGIITALLSARLVNRMVVAIAPKIIGQGIEAIGDLGITKLSEALTFTSFKTERLGLDMIFDGLLKETGVSGF
jgi:diaminohydroxyphosphoribosylaminopyrimidine deaminase / 5-amino-6-(5-phosphoribosylamino)uracil reductase